MSYLKELLPEFRKGAKIKKDYWGDDQYIYYFNGNIFCKDGRTISLTTDEITFGGWELYKDPEPDWQYIIDNKCLCEFWDDEEYSIVGYLVKIREKGECLNYKFMEKNGRSWINCRPVRKDKVTFYEEKNNE